MKKLTQAEDHPVDKLKPFEGHPFYVKDDELFYNTLSNKNIPFQVTLDFCGDLEYEIRYYSALYDTQISEDGKNVFYADKYNEDGSVSLYYRNIEKTDSPAIKLDSGISHFKASKDGKKVVYKKGDTLYEHNLKEKNKIDSDVEIYYISEDLEKIVYKNSDNDLYFKQEGQAKVKIDSNISSVEYLGENYEYVVYTKEEAIYKSTIGKDKVKIASDVHSVVAVYETGEMYYTKETIDMVSWMQYIDDDMLDTDNALAEIDYPSRPYSYEYDTYEEYEEAYAAYEKAYEKYYENRDAIEEKTIRDNLRSLLKEKQREVFSYALYYYNGDSEELVVKEGYNYESLNDTPVVAYVEKVKSSSKIKMSSLDIDNIYSFSDLEYIIYEAEDYDRKYSVVIGENVSTFESTNLSRLEIDSKSENIYYIANDSGEVNHGDLYKFNLSSKKTEIYDTDVFIDELDIYDDNILYFKNVDVESEHGELYINQKLIDYDVYRYRIVDYYDKLYYYVDRDIEDSNGTLKVYDGKKIEKISDDVNTYDVAPNGDVYFLSNYSMKYYTGTLMQYKKGKINHIDDDVSELLVLSHSD